MIQAVQEQELVLTSNTSAIPFDNVDLRTNSANCFNGWLNHNEGSALFNILGGGIYEISFNTNITSATSGNVALAIFVDGTQLEGSEMDMPVTTGIYSNVSTHKYIRVCNRGNASISIRAVPTITYNGTTTDTEIPTIKNANISIVRRSGI
jgi:hypothetical protein